MTKLSKFPYQRLNSSVSFPDNSYESAVCALYEADGVDDDDVYSAYLNLLYEYEHTARQARTLKYLARRYKSYLDVEPEIFAIPIQPVCKLSLDDYQIVMNSEYESLINYLNDNNVPVEFESTRIRTTKEHFPLCIEILLNLPSYLEVELDETLDEFLENYKAMADSKPSMSIEGGVIKYNNLFPSQHNFIEAQINATRLRNK